MTISDQLITVFISAAEIRCERQRKGSLIGIKDLEKY